MELITEKNSKYTKTNFLEVDHNLKSILLIRAVVIFINAIVLAKNLRKHASKRKLRSRQTKSLSDGESNPGHPRVTGGDTDRYTIEDEGISFEQIPNLI